MAYGFGVTIACDGDRCGEFVASTGHRSVEAAFADAEERARRFGWRIRGEQTWCAAHAPGRKSEPPAERA
jgi:hypothetical protein